jgi:hypothetical protein
MVLAGDLSLTGLDHLAVGAQLNDHPGTATAAVEVFVDEVVVDAVRVGCN